MNRSCVCAALGASLFLLLSAAASAAPLTWTVDSSQSYLSLALPTQPVTLNGTPSGNAFARNQGATSGSWTVGNQAPIAGTLATDWQAGSHIQFLGGAHNLTAVESGAFAPDFATWNSGTNTFNPPDSTAPAAFGGQLGTTQFGIVLIVVQDAARFAIRDVQYDLNSAAIPLAGDQFAAGSASFSVGDAQAGLRGNSMYSIPSDYGSLADVGISVGGANGAAFGSVTTPDPFNPNQLQLTLPISVLVALQLFDGTLSTLQGTAEGVIVAYAVVPEPSTVALLAVGLSGITLLRMRRRLKS